MKRSLLVASGSAVGAPNRDTQHRESQFATLFCAARFVALKVLLLCSRILARFLIPHSLCNVDTFGEHCFLQTIKDRPTSLIERPNTICKAITFLRHGRPCSTARGSDSNYRPPLNLLRFRLTHLPLGSVRSVVPPPATLGPHLVLGHLRLPASLAVSAVPFCFQLMRENLSRRCHVSDHIAFWRQLRGSL